MTEIDSAAFASDEEMEARVRPLVNEILERFNQENVSPSQAGLVVLALMLILGGLPAAAAARAASK